MRTGRANPPSGARERDGRGEVEGCELVNWGLRSLVNFARSYQPITGGVRLVEWLDLCEERDGEACMKIYSRCKDCVLRSVL